MGKTFRYSGYVTSTGFDTPLLLLFNGDTQASGRKLTVISANARQIKSQVSTGQGKVCLQRITAVTGGDNVGIVKADTGNASLPSQVKININSDVTIGSSIFTSQLNFPLNSTNPFTWRATGVGHNLSAQWYTSRGEGSTQHIKLAEGEGVAITQLDTTPAASGVFQLVATIKIGTEYHYINTAMYARDYPTASFSIMNESGSGVTIELTRLEINEVGDSLITTAAANAPYVGYKKVEGYDGGEEVTPFAHDSADSLHATTKLIRNRLHLNLDHIEVGSKAGSPNKYGYGYPSAFMMQARSAGLYRQGIITIADSMNVGLATAFPASALRATGVSDIDFTKKNSSFDGIVLNGGEGFAIQAMNMSHYSAFYVEIEFTHTEPVAAGGGLKSIAITT